MKSVDDFKKIDLSFGGFRYLSENIDLHEILLHARRQYGDKLQLQFGDGSFYFFSEAEHVRTIFNEGHRRHRGPLKEMVGNGLFSRETSSERLVVRRKLQSIYTVSRIDSLYDYLHEKIKNILQQWPVEKKGVFFTAENLFKRCKEISININVSIVFGRYTNEKIIKAITCILEYVDKGLFDEDRPGVLLPKDHDDFNQAKKTVYNAIENIVSNKDDFSMTGIETGADSQCILELLKTVLSKEGKPDIQSINDEVLSLLGSGLETSGTMMFWLLYILANNQKVQNKVRILARNYTQESVHRDFLSHVVSETLRLYPAAWANFRTIDKDIKIGDFHVPAGSSLCVSPYVTQRDERYWDNPDKFIPERFSDVSMQERYKNFEFFPFAGGTHRCLAERLALLEQQVFLSTFFQLYSIETPYNFELKSSSRLSLEPKGNGLFCLQMCDY